MYEKIFYKILQLYTIRRLMLCETPITACLSSKQKVCNILWILSVHKSRKISNCYSLFANMHHKHPLICSLAWFQYLQLSVNSLKCDLEKKQKKSAYLSTWCGTRVSVSTLAGASLKHPPKLPSVEVECCSSSSTTPDKQKGSFGRDNQSWTLCIPEPSCLMLVCCVK